MITFQTYTASVKVNGAVREAKTIASCEWYAKVNISNHLKVPVQNILFIQAK